MRRGKRHKLNGRRSGLCDRSKRLCDAAYHFLSIDAPKTWLSTRTMNALLSMQKPTKL